ncbi:YycH family regulatory protein [Cytobacillus sp. FJAT-54145]|uniref:YycH family regulatory protein n=1 Tax=Cytobacillus spartinae TaxID=3299023 RepID=A0ABW6KGL8_9BACI
MTYENIKSIILAILIVLSVLLTWGLWTYQPNYDIMENAKTVQEVALSEKKDLKEIVRPDRIFYHSRESHLGTNDPLEINKTIKELSRWNFNDFQDISSGVDNLEEFLQDQNKVEIVYPDIIPIDLYKNVLNIKVKDELNIGFDRIVISLENTTRESGFVYFISYSENTVVQSRVTASFITNYETNFYTNAANNPKFIRYVAEETSEGRSLFVTEDPVTMSLYNYLIDPLPTEKFRDALFNDPSFVQNNYIAPIEEYTDGSTLLTINHDQNNIFYVNPAQENEVSMGANNILQKSIDFVNGHGGWTDPYRYVGMDPLGQSIVFRLYDPNGYPIFSDTGISEVLQVWGENEINKYLRNNFSLGRRVESMEITLLSGKDALENLKKLDDFNPEFLQDLVLGYKMSKETQGPLVQLEPSWFYKYNDQWWILPTDQNGGLKHGLE